MARAQHRELPLAADRADLEASDLECLLFRCGGQLLGCETSRAARVLRPPRMTSLPCTSGIVVGLFNYQGEIVGAIDLKPLLSGGHAGTSDGQWLVVLKGKQFLAGLFIDEVLGIETIPKDSLVNAAPDQPGFLPKNFTVAGTTAALLSVDALLAHPAVVVTQ